LQLRFLEEPLVFNLKNLLVEIGVVILFTFKKVLAADKPSHERCD
jgi:hypothetical protein